MVRILFGVSALLNPLQVDAHAYMANPTSRGVLYSTTPHGLGAFGPGNYINACGQSSNSRANTIVIRDENVNHYNSNRDCISTVKIGSIFRVHARILAHHIGHMEVRLCAKRISSNRENLDDCELLLRARADEVPSVDCSNHNVLGPDDVCLPVDSTNPERWYMSPCLSGGYQGAGAMGEWCEKFMYFHVPSNLQETDEATLQWYYKTGNSCVTGPNATSECDFIHHTLQADHGQNLDWCSNQWRCKNCESHPGIDALCYNFSSNSGGSPHRTCCGEVFTTCADVKLKNSKGSTTGPTSTSKLPFVGSAWPSIQNAQGCQNTAMDVVYADDTDPYGPESGAFAAPTGGGGGAATGGSSSGYHKDDRCLQCNADDIKCCVPAWSEPCHPWSTTAAACERLGGQFCDGSAVTEFCDGSAVTDPVPNPEPEPEPEPTPVVADPDPAPTPVVAEPAPTPVQSSGTCCWSSWGDSSQCRGYSGSGGKCNNNWNNACGGNADCGAGLLELQGDLDLESCQWTSVSDQASNLWCEQNCFAASVLHPACDPDTDENHKFCLCTKTSLMQTPATKFSSGVTSKAKVVRHANVDAAGHLRLDA